MADRTVDDILAELEPETFAPKPAPAPVTASQRSVDDIVAELEGGPAPVVDTRKPNVGMDDLNRRDLLGAGMDLGATVESTSIQQGASPEDALRRRMDAEQTTMVLGPRADSGSVRRALEAREGPDSAGKAAQRAFGQGLAPLPPAARTSVERDDEARRREREFREQGFVDSVKRAWAGDETEQAPAENEVAADKLWLQRAKDDAGKVVLSTLTAGTYPLIRLALQKAGLEEYDPTPDASSGPVEGWSALIEGMGEDEDVQALSSPEAVGKLGVKAVQASGIGPIVGRAAATVEKALPDPLVRAAEEAGLDIGTTALFWDDVQPREKFDAAAQAFYETGDRSGVDGLTLRDLPARARGDSVDVAAFLRMADAGDPDVAFLKTIADKDERYVAAQIERLPLSVVGRAQPSLVPDAETLRDVHVRRTNAKEYAGDAEADSLLRLMGAGLVRPVDNGENLLFVPGRIMEAMRIAGVPLAAVNEIEVNPWRLFATAAALPTGFARPVYEAFEGAPEPGDTSLLAKAKAARVPTGAGLQSMAASGAFNDWLESVGLDGGEKFASLYEPGSTWESRTLTAAMLPEYQFRLLKDTFTRAGGDPASGTADVLGAADLLANFVIPAEEIAIAPAMSAARATMRARAASGAARELGMAGREARAAAVAAALSGDGIQSGGEALRRQALDLLESGRLDPDAISPTARRQIVDLFRDGGVADPEQYVEELFDTLRDRRARVLDENAAVVAKGGPETRRLRDSDPYQRVKAELDTLVRTGNLTPAGRDLMLRFNEAAAFSAWDEGEIGSPEDWFASQEWRKGVEADLASAGPGTLFQMEMVPVTADEIAAELKQTQFIPNRRLLEILGDRRPEYLDNVAAFILEQREKVRQGRLTARDVAKAYLPTVASQRAGAIDAARVEEILGPLDDRFIVLGKKGQRQVRPEEAMAAWMFSPDGRRALDAIERGVFDAEAWESVAKLRDIWGNNTLRNSGVFGDPRKGAVTMQNIQQVVDEINAAGGDVRKVEEAVRKLNGIGNAKTPFISHLLGFGESPTMDAVEFNGWLAGRADVGTLKTRQANLARNLKARQDNTKIANAMADRAMDRFRKLRAAGVPGTDLPDEVFGAIMHHWFWDRLKGAETTHAGMYDAMRYAMEESGVLRGDIGPASAPRTRADVEASPEFKAWFGDSKVVDAEGRPLVVYHGTGDAFDEFKAHRAGKRVDSGYLGSGFYFTSDPQIADYYAKFAGGAGENVMPVYLSLQRPYEWRNKGAFSVRQAIYNGPERLPSDIRDDVVRRAGWGFNPSQEPNFAMERELSRAIREVLEERGFDGVVADLGGGTREIVAFNPTQIKSATGNRGTFDPNNPSILYSEEGGRVAGSIERRPTLTAHTGGRTATGRDRLAENATSRTPTVLVTDEPIGIKLELARNAKGPFRAIDSTISGAALVGPRGEVALAKGGVLFVQDADQLSPVSVKMLNEGLAAMSPEDRPWVVATSRTGEVGRTGNATITGADVFPIASRDIFGGITYRTVDDGPLYSVEDGRVAGSIERMPADANLVVQHNLTPENLLYADKLGGLVAPSIGIGNVNAPYTGFGTITLIGPTSMADPAKSGIRWFDADVYSPRWPNKVYKVDAKKADAWNRANLAPYRDRVGTRYVSDLAQAAAVTQRSEGWGSSWSELKNDPAMKLKYIEEVLGQRPTVPTKVDSRYADVLAAPPVRDVLAEIPDADIRRLIDEVPEDLRGRVEAAVRGYADDAGARVLAATNDEGAAKVTRNHILEIVGMRQRNPGGGRPPMVDAPLRDDVLRELLYDEGKARKGPQPDRVGASRKFADIIAKSDGGTEAYERWYDAQLDAVRGPAMLVPDGKSRPKPYTAENILAELVKNTRGGENFNYGLGSARSKGAKEYRSLKGIQADRARVVSETEMTAAKQVLQDEFDALVEALAPYYTGTSGLLDEAATVIGESYRKGVTGALKTMFKGVPRDVALAVQDFAEKLRQAPTEYLEGKAGRIVRFNEFEAAVVPDDLPAAAREVLERNGVELVPYKAGDNADRARAIAEAAQRKGVLFQRVADTVRGFIQPNPSASRWLIRLFQTGDLRTAFHEGGHLQALMRPGWEARAAKVFDSVNGRLTREGHEQLADAVTRLLRGTFRPGSRADNLAADALDALGDLWSRVRELPIVSRLQGTALDRLPRAIPPEFARLWDETFRPHTRTRPVAARLVDERQPRGMRAPVFLPGDIDARLAASKKRAAGVADEFNRVDRAPAEIRAALGLKQGDVEADPINLLANAMAYIGTERMRRSWGFGELVPLTNRVAVPAARQEAILREWNARRMAALGNREPTPDGTDLLFDANQQAGLRRLIREAEESPLGEILPASLTDDGADLSRVPAEDYNRLMDVHKEIRAGMGAFRNARAEQAAVSGAVRLLNKAAEGLERTDAAPVLRKIKEAFSTSHVAEEYLGPAARDLIKAVERELAEVPTQIKREIIEVAETWRQQGRAFKAIDLVRDLSYGVGPEVVPVDEVGRLLRLGTLTDAPDLARVVADLDEIDALFVNAPLTNAAEQVATESMAIAHLTQIDRALADMDVPDFEAAVAASGLTAEQANDAMGIVLEGIRRRVASFENSAVDILISLTGTDDVAILDAIKHKPTRQAKLQRVYDAWYTGRWDVALDEVARMGYATSGPAFDQGSAALTALLRLRSRQVLGQLAYRLADAGLTGDVTKLARGGVSYDRPYVLGSMPGGREVFIEDVANYISTITGWGDRPDYQIRIYGVDGVEVPSGTKPYNDAVKALLDQGYRLRDAVDWTSFDIPNVGRAEVRFNPAEGELTKRGVVNRDAYAEAVRVLSSYGFKTGKGTDWTPIDLPGGARVMVPSLIREPLEQVINQASPQSIAFRVGSAAERIGDVSKGASAAKAPGVAVQGINAAMRILQGMWDYSYGMLRTGLLTGIGPFVRPAYYVGNAFGGFMQLLQGMGTLGAARVLGEAAADFGTTRRVIQRMYQDGTGIFGVNMLSPAERGFFGKDGRYFTDSMIANMANRAGLNSSLPKSEFAESLIETIRREEPTWWNNIQRIPWPGSRAWREHLNEGATAIDNFYRVSTFMDGLKRGLSETEAANLARRVAFDYNDLTEFERKFARRVIMFYTFFRRNQDLFWWTLLNHPERVAAQLRLMNGLQREALETESEVYVPDWMDDRVPFLFRDALKEGHATNAQAGRMTVTPGIPIPAALSLWLDLYGAAGQPLVDLALGDAPTVDGKAVTGLVGLATPAVQFPFVAATKVDPDTGRPLTATAVPALLAEPFAELDDALTGGLVMRDMFGLRKVNPWDDASTARPGAPVWQIQGDGPLLAWWAFNNMTPAGPVLNQATQYDRAIPGGLNEPRVGLTEADEAATILGARTSTVPRREVILGREKERRESAILSRERAAMQGDIRKGE